MPIRYYTILSISLLSQACTTTSLKEKAGSSICTVTSRKPASISCEELFKNTPNEQQTFEQVITQLPQYFTQLREQHSFSDTVNENLFAKSYFDHAAHRYHSIGATLFEEFFMGSKAALIYKKLGFHEPMVSDPYYAGPQRDKDKIHVLLPPQSIIEVYRYI